MNLSYFIQLYPGIQFFVGEHLLMQSSLDKKQYYDPRGGINLGVYFIQDRIGIWK